MDTNSKRGFQDLCHHQATQVQVMKPFEKNTKTLKRKTVNSEDRKQAIINKRELLQTAKSQIGIKQQRIQKQKSCNDFKKCDELTSEMRALLKEKAELENRLAALERKEAKSKWYKKKKTEEKAQPEMKESILEKLVRSGSTASKPSEIESDQSGDTVILEDDPKESSDNSNL